MIHSLIIENFLSFKEEITFSFEANNDKKHTDRNVVEITKGVRISRLAIVYGANASGKSNLVKAFQFINDFWEFTPTNKEENIDYTPFKLDSESKHKPTKLSLVFYAERTKYIYEVQLLDNIVQSEKLTFYPGIKPALVFYRYQKEKVAIIEFGSKVKISQLIKELLEAKCLQNISLFSAYKQVNVNINLIDKVIEWKRSNFLLPITPKTQLMSFSDGQISSDVACKKAVLQFLKKADFNISDIVLKDENEKLSDEVLDNISQYISKLTKGGFSHKNQIRESKLEFIHQITASNGKHKEFPLAFNEQSEGTIRTFELAGVFYLLSKDNPFLAIDEIEAKLHPTLIEHFLTEFLTFQNKSQLLLTTHYDNLLDIKEILRNDTFWFTEKDNDGSTDLYRLTQFNELNRISSLQKAYRYGNFGAIPEIEEE